MARLAETIKKEVLRPLKFNWIHKTGLNRDEETINLSFPDSLAPIRRTKQGIKYWIESEVDAWAEIYYIPKVKEGRERNKLLDQIIENKSLINKVKKSLKESVNNESYKNSGATTRISSKDIE